MFPSATLPYVIGLATAAWFCFLARRAGRGLLLWTLGGGFLGLVVSMVCVGLAHAVAVPYSDARAASFQLRGVAFAVLLLGLTSAGLTLWLSRQKSPLLSPKEEP